MNDDIGNILGLKEESGKKVSIQHPAEIRKSAVGTIFTVLGVLNLLVGAFGLILLFGGNSIERAQGAVISISCLSGMFVCFAVASALHFLCEIACRLERLQGGDSSAASPNEKKNGA